MSSRPLIPRLREARHRGNLSVKTMHAAFPPRETFQLLTAAPKMSPVQLIDCLHKCSRTASPSSPLLSAIAQRCTESAHLFYPPQILETLGLFAKISYSRETLFEFVNTRKSDLLAEPSPKRVVDLVSVLSELGLPLWWEGGELQAALVAALPQLKRGIPAVLEALSNQPLHSLSAHDPPLLVLSLLVQAELNFRAGETERGVLVKSVEAASRMVKNGCDRMSIVLNQLRSSIELLKNGKLGFSEKVLLATAAQRLGMEFPSPFISVMSSPKLTLFEQARLIELAARSGYTLSLEELEHVLNFLETCDRTVAQKFLPYNLLSVLRMSPGGGPIGPFELLMERSLQSTPERSTLSAEKLFCLVRASSILDMARRGDQETVGLNTPDENPLVESFRDSLRCSLSPLLPQLTVRQRRLLWECGVLSPAPGLVDESIGAFALPLVGGSWETHRVGPYWVQKSQTEGAPQMSLVCPGHLLMRAGKWDVRPDLLLRKRAIEAVTGGQVVLEPL